MRSKRLAPPQRITVIFKLGNKILPPAHIEKNAHLFDPRCFNSKELDTALLELDAIIPAGMHAVLYISNKFKLFHKFIADDK